MLRRKVSNKNVSHFSKVELPERKRRRRTDERFCDWYSPPSSWRQSRRIDRTQLSFRRTTPRSSPHLSLYPFFRLWSNDHLLPIEGSSAPNEDLVLVVRSRFGEVGRVARRFDAGTEVGEFEKVQGGADRVLARDGFGFPWVSTDGPSPFSFPSPRLFKSSRELIRSLMTVSISRVSNMSSTTRCRNRSRSTSIE